MQVNNLSMQFDTGYDIRQQDGSFKDWQYRNDTRFLLGKKGQYLTDNFNEIATALPVFERLRQLAALTHSLQAIKDLGYCPDPELQKYIDKKYDTFSQSSFRKKVMRDLPLHDKVDTNTIEFAL